MKFKTLTLIALIFLSHPAFADWQIKKNDLKTFEKFAKTDEVELYTGDTILHDFENIPTEGHKFVLVKIAVTNQDTSIPPLNSLAFKLKINDKTYSRIDNDKFLLNYNIKPFTRLKIKKGTHEGHLLFEIPTAELSNNVTLFYNDKPIQ